MSLQMPSALPCEDVFGVFQLPAMIGADPAEPEQPNISSRTLKHRYQRQRRHYSPISRLPAEILANVFLAWRNLTSVHEEMRKPKRTWLVALRISRHWRAVALSCPSLWSHIFVGTGYPCVFERAADRLIKSKDTPLAIEIDCEARDAEVIALLLGQLPRTRHLALFNIQVAELDRLHPKLTSKAPLLKSFVLCEGNQTLFGIHRRYVFPANLFGRDAPNLRLLVATARSCFCWEPLFCASTLTTLHVNSKGGSVMLAQILAVLRPMIQLEVMDLNMRATTVVLENNIRSVTATELPRLLHLSLISDMNSCVDLLEKLTLPKIQSLDLNLRGGSDDLVGRLVPLAGQIFRTSPRFPQQPVNLRFVPDGYSGDTTSEMWSTIGGLPSRYFRLAISATLTLPPAYFTTLPFTHIAEVEISDEHLPSLIVQYVLAHGSSVHTLRCHGTTLFPLLEQLADDWGAMVLPLLTELVFSWATLEPCVQALALLSRWLRARAASGYGLKAMRFIVRHPAPADREQIMVQLQDVVPVLCFSDAFNEGPRWEGEDGSWVARLDAL